MTWFKVDDHLHSHRKTMRAGTEAMGLWVIAGSWAAAELSDGWVPSYVLTRLVGANGEALAQRLVQAGLWHAEDVDGEDGYRFHAWADFQPTRAAVEAKREDARERMRLARAQGGSVRANGAGTSRAVTPTPTRPDPTRNNTPAADAAESEDFAAFWTAYPRKVGKAAAAKAHAKALRTATAAAVLAGLDQAKAGWTAARTETQFIPHPATWLNQGRWEDQPELPADMVAPLVARRTQRQCTDPDPHGQHPWETGQGHPHMCLGVSL